MNHKMDGDLKKIQAVGKYFIEIWKACGMELSRVKFLWASEEINKHHDEYWEIVLNTSTRLSLDIAKRCMQIMGIKKGKSSITTSQILYPIMQCADVFFLGVDVAQLGMNQRKVNRLVIEGADKLNFKSPVILSHHMLMGLKKGQPKMSKSDPDSAMLMEDTETDVIRKINKAYCPEKQVEEILVSIICTKILLRFDSIVIESVIEQINAIETWINNFQIVSNEKRVKIKLIDS
jgi:tyrosyl-tRNA synthetase